MHIFMTLTSTKCHHSEIFEVSSQAFPGNLVTTLSMVDAVLPGIGLVKCCLLNLSISGYSSSAHLMLRDI